MLAAVTLAIASRADADIRLPDDTPPSYRTECGTCHDPFAPQLMRKADWKQVVAGLDRHYGVNAALSADEVQPIAAFLDRRGADDADARMAAAELRLTATEYFRRRHASVSRAAWAHADVKRPSNCGGCHFTSDQGVFGHDVSIPGGR